MILLDTGGLLAALFPDRRHHERCAAVIASEPGPFVLSPFVLAEVDYPVFKLAGVDVEPELLAEVARGAYLVPSLEMGDYALIHRVAAEYRDLGVGLADAPSWRPPTASAAWTS